MVVLVWVCVVGWVFWCLVVVGWGVGWLFGVVVVGGWFCFVGGEVGFVDLCGGVVCV